MVPKIELVPKIGPETKNQKLCKPWCRECQGRYPVLPTIFTLGFVVSRPASFERSSFRARAAAPRSSISRPLCRTSVGLLSSSPPKRRGSEDRHTTQTVAFERAFLFGLTRRMGVTGRTTFAGHAPQPPHHHLEILGGRGWAKHF